MVCRNCTWALLITLVALAPPLIAIPAQKAPNSSASNSRKLPPDWPFQPPSPEKSVEIGNFYFRRHDYQGALGRYLEAVHSNPDYAPAYLGLGKTYEATGKPREALTAYEKYLAELPSDRAAERAKAAQRAVKRLKQELAKNK